MVEIGPQPRDEHVNFTLDPALATTLGDNVKDEFLPHAARMPNAARRLLLEGIDPSRVPPAELLDELHLDDDVRAAAGRGLSSSSSVLSRPAVLPPHACARLRAAVDAERQELCDSVDGAPNHQLNLDAARLDELIGDAAASAALWALTSEHAAIDAELNASDVSAARGVEIFVRRYSAGTRPWNPFHTDSSALTINVALVDDSAFTGGKLLACYGHAVRRVARAEGEATVHASTLLHGVSRMTSGVRYALIIFVGRRAEGSAAPPVDARAEAEALADLMADTALLERCEAVCGAGTAQSLRRRYARLAVADVGRAVEAVVLALRTHGEKNAAVAKFGCAALSNLCQDTDTNAAAIAAAISAGAAPVVQAAMRAHPYEIYLRTVFGPGLLAKLRSGRSRRDEQ